MKNCPNCNAELKDGVRFCRHCGTKLEEKKEMIFCDYCGEQVEAGTVFCDFCGEKLIEEDNPWGEFDKQKNDDPWASFADYKEPETIVVEKPVEVVIEKVVEKIVETPVVAEVSKETCIQDEVENAINAFHRKDYAFATGVFEKFANLGDAQAQYWFATCYARGKGVGKSNAKARDWYFKSAEQGNPEAMVALANFYWNGYGVKKSQVEQEKWLKKAAEIGGGEYKYRLAEFYGKYSDPRRYKDAEVWYLKSAEQGYGPAMYELAFAYYNEYHMRFPNDFKKAIYWNDKGMEIKDHNSFYLRAEWYRWGSCGFAKDKTKAAEYYRKAIEYGNPHAKSSLERL